MKSALSVSGLYLLKKIYEKIQNPYHMMEISI